jgi:hypothetical protein
MGADDRAPDDPIGPPEGDVALDDLEARHGQGWVGLSRVMMDMDKNLWIARGARVYLDPWWRDDGTAPVGVARAGDGGLVVDVGHLKRLAGARLYREEVADDGGWVQATGVVW